MWRHDTEDKVLFEVEQDFWSDAISHHYVVCATAAEFRAFVDALNEVFAGRRDSVQLGAARLAARATIGEAIEISRSHVTLRTGSRRSVPVDLSDDDHQSLVTFFHSLLRVGHDGETATWHSKRSDLSIVAVFQRDDDSSVEAGSFNLWKLRIWANQWSTINPLATVRLSKEATQRTLDTSDGRSLTIYGTAIDSFTI
ncbi:hypothetical protein [Trueperella bialowiezensis]|uniref:Uncharacterized protein n=1 Tax=Trueperella bialowiezensis TaxID=312285 RepID=A0A448PFV6_9ACTO|nr:hypothetical protein [Trueperella bialowiezensis]VEI13798.1 Uncharacterised protein [Trueperella bialowiezensis]